MRMPGEYTKTKYIKLGGTNWKITSCRRCVKKFPTADRRDFVLSKTYEKKSTVDGNLFTGVFNETPNNQTTNEPDWRKRTVLEPSTQPPAGNTQS